MSAFQFAQIGVIRSPYKEKFAVPRQPGLVKHGGGELHLVAPYNQADAVRGLLQVGTAVRDRLTSVARLSAQIDELADPQGVLAREVCRQAGL